MTGTASSRWLLVGGAGYIGSHILRAFLVNGLDVVVMDDFSSGQIERVPEEIPILPLSCEDPQAVLEAFHTWEIDGLIHLAARKHARESTRRPLDYWHRNIAATLGIARAVSDYPLKYLIYSSSCSIFGDAPGVAEMPEFDPKSPYARTKLASEWMLQDVTTRAGIKFVALRYFNVIGCSSFPGALDTSTECVVPATAAAISSGRSPVVFGSRFETPDGSAMRDYVDVRDLANAHALVARALARDEYLPSGIQVSTGSPTSVYSVVKGVSDSLASELPVELADQQPGDPDQVWAAPSAELLQLGWHPQISILESIESHCGHPDFASRYHPGL